MPARSNAELHEFRDWIFRLRPATTIPSKLLVMLHGLTGDENSMWVFSRMVPKHMAVLASRGPYSATEGGYSWRENKFGSLGLPALDEFRPSAEALLFFLGEWCSSEEVNGDQIDLIGFSQGAALSCAIALLHPDRVEMQAMLSGFIPGGAEILLAKRPLEGKPVFVTYGRRDNIIPVELARRTVELLEGSGERVMYCESDEGHKVSTDCFADLPTFFR